MAGGKKVFDCVECSGLMMLIITGVASTAIRPEPTKGAVCSAPTSSCAVPDEAGEGHEIDHGFWLSWKGLQNN